MSEEVTLTAAWEGTEFERQHSAPARQTKAYKTSAFAGLLLCTVLIAACATFLAFGRNPSHRTSTPLYVKLVPVADGDLKSFGARLSNLTASKPWPERCVIYRQVLTIPPCELSTMCPAETIDLANYYKDTARHQPVIRAMIVLSTHASHVDCKLGVVSESVLSMLPKPMLSVHVTAGTPIAPTDLITFYQRLRALTVGRTWKDICSIYAAVQNAPCTSSKTCPPAVAELADYYSDNFNDRPAIQTLIAASLIEADVSC